MKTFDEIKQAFLKRFRKLGVYTDYYDKANKTKNVDELLMVIKNNMKWFIDTKIIDTAFLENMFGTEMLVKNHIYTFGEHSLKSQDDLFDIYILGNSSVDVGTWDDSRVGISLWDNSQVEVNAFDSSHPKISVHGNASANIITSMRSSADIDTYDNSSVKICTWLKSSVTINTFGDSSVNVNSWDESLVDASTFASSITIIKTLDHSAVDVRTRNKSKVRFKTLNNSRGSVNVGDTSSVYVETSGNSFVDAATHGDSSKLNIQVNSQNSIVLLRNKREIHMKKDAFKTVKRK